MSGATSAAILIGGAMAASTAYQMYQGNKANQQQRSAQRQALATADEQAKAADEANNRANRKTPDVAGALSAALQSGKGGASGTMLTGADGVNPGALPLGKSTLLGG